ncbi:hypothetical protein HDU83_001776 [Entophlyctis luteolus]|nr:hypothetical protein HDU83_001776 [Entophlyctis luteolus]
MARSLDLRQTLLVTVVSALAVSVDALFFARATGHHNHHLSAASIQTSINCLYTYLPSANDTCGSSISSFEEMNPNVTCRSGVTLVQNELVCVSSSPTDGETNNITCSMTYELKSTDSCTTVGSAFSLSSTALLELNPYLDCLDTGSYIGQALCLEGKTTDGEATIGGPSKVSNNTLVLSPNCTQSVKLSANSSSCVDFVKAYSNVSVTQLAQWNTNLDCWNLTAYSGQELCINSSTFTAPATVVASSNTVMTDGATSTTMMTTTTTTTSTTTTSTTTSTTTTTTTTQDANSGSGTYYIKFTEFGNGEYTDPSAFMCGKSGYASSMPDPSDIIAISQKLGLQLFDAYLTESQKDNFEYDASPMCMSQIEITSNGVTFTKTIYDVCDDLNGPLPGGADENESNMQRKYEIDLPGCLAPPLRVVETSFQPLESNSTEPDKNLPEGCLFVASLSTSATDEELHHSVVAHFSQWGQLTNVKVLKDWLARPYAFVQYENPHDASVALTRAYNTLICGRYIRVEQAKVNRTLFIGKFGNISEHELRAVLDTFGPIEDLSILHNYQSGKSKGSGFVKFRFRDDAIKAYLGIRQHHPWSIEWATNLDRKPDVDLNSVFVGQLNPSLITEDMLRSKFEKYGEIVSLQVVNKIVEGQDARPAFGFITFTKESSAQHAIESEVSFPDLWKITTKHEHKNGKLWLERNIRVQYREVGENKGISRRSRQLAAAGGEAPTVWGKFRPKQTVRQPSTIPENNQDKNLKQSVPSSYPLVSSTIMNPQQAHGPSAGYTTAQQFPQFSLPPGYTFRPISDQAQFAISSSAHMFIPPGHLPVFIVPNSHFPGSISGEIQHAIDSALRLDESGFPENEKLQPKISSIQVPTPAPSPVPPVTEDQKGISKDSIGRLSIWMESKSPSLFRHAKNRMWGHTRKKRETASDDDALDAGSDVGEDLEVMSAMF